MILTISLVGCLITIVCAGKCWRKHDVMCCEDSMPNKVQIGVTSVKIFNLDLSVYLQTDIFQHRSWRNVEHLEVQPDVDSTGGKSLDVETRPWFVLPSTFSDHLYNLVELSLTSKKLLGLHKGALHNLTKLEVLDFARNVELTFTNFTAALLGNSMNNLKRLNISQLSARVQLMRTFGRELFDCFRNSKLQELDLSKVRSVMIPEFFYDAFPFLQSLNLEDSGNLYSNLLTAMYLKPNGSSFKFLKKLNVNNAFFPDEAKDWTYLIPGETVKSQTPQLNLTHLWAKNVVIGGLESVPYLANLGDRVVIGLSFPDLNITRSAVALPVNKMGAISLQVLDISQNIIKSIDLALTAALTLKQMKDFDISNNRLYLMESRKFKYIFKGSSNVYRINISNNLLFKLPVEIFSTNTNLEYIDLSQNKLSTLSFQFSHLIKLKVLDISFNEIHYIDNSVVSKIYNLRESVLTFREEFTIKLAGNPFVRSCESKEFMKWILDPGFSNFIQPQTFDCIESESQTSVIIDENALANAEFECKRTMIIGVSSAVSAVFVIMLGIFVFIMCRRYRARKREKKIALYIAKRNENKANKQTPIFLSYCSENEDFVSNVIYPSLNTSLQKILKTKKRCIATGDLDFQPGIHVTEGIVTCIETCSVFVACVSKSFCRKPWCKSEVLTAIHEQRPVILIFLEEVETSLMPKVMRKHFLATTRVTWSNQDAIPKPDVETICQGIVQLMANEQDESNIDRRNNEYAVPEDERQNGYTIDNEETIL